MSIQSEFSKFYANLGSFLLFSIAFLFSQTSYAIPTLISGVDLSGGEPVQVSLQKPKLGTVVVFLSSKCPCSASHQATLRELAKEFEKDGFNFVGVNANTNEDIDLAREHFKNAKLGFPVIRDEKAKIADEFSAFKTPHVFVVSPKLEVLFQGGVDNSKLVERANRHYLRDALIAIREGKEPAEKNVRVLGCEIKR
jgi:peroxiredoxin